MSVRDTFLRPRRQDYSLGDIASNFALSAISSFGPEFIGLDPLPGVEDFRADRPLLGGASQLIGYAVPYAGWAKATSAALKGTRALRALAPYARTLETLRAPGKGQVLRGAAEGALFTLPVDAARVGSTLTTDYLEDSSFDDVGQTLTEGAIGVGLGGAFGGVGAGIRAFGKKLPSGPPMPEGIDQTLSMSQQLRSLEDLNTKGLISPEQYTHHKARLSTSILTEEPLSVAYDQAPKYINTIEGLTPERTARLNTNFRETPGSTRGFRRQRISIQSGLEQTKIDEVLNKAGIAGALDSVQFPTYITTNSENGARAVQAALRGTKKEPLLQSMENGDLFFGREVDEGLFLVAKRIKRGVKAAAADPASLSPRAAAFARARAAKGDVGAAASGDEWVIFKTDNPSLASPTLAKYGKAYMTRNAWLFPHKVIKPIGDETWDGLMKMSDEYELHNFLDEGEDGAIAKMLKPLDRKKFADGPSFSTAKAIQEFFRTYLAPASHAFTGSARASRVWGLSKAAADKMNAEVQATLYGKAALKDGGIWKTIVSPSVADGEGMKGLFGKLSDEDLAVFQDLYYKKSNKMLGETELKDMFLKQEISPELYTALSVAGEKNQAAIDSLNKILKAAGRNPVPHLDGDLGFALSLPGSLRVVVRDEAGVLRGRFGGHTKQEAQQAADDFIARVGKPGWTKGPTKVASPRTDVDDSLRGDGDVTFARSQEDEALRVLGMSRRPTGKSRTLAAARMRTGLPGHIGTGKPPTRDELFEAWAGQHKRLRELATQVSVNHQFRGEMLKLAAEAGDTNVYKGLNDRLDALFGYQGPIAQGINDVADELFAPMLGKNSATKMSGALNTAIFNLQLGMGNPVFPASNIVGTIQTLLPQISFALRAPPEHLAKFFSTIAAVGKGGVTRGAVGVLDEFKVTREIFRLMGKPTPELKKILDDLLGDGTLEPRFVEEHVGANSVNAQRFRDAFEDPLKGGVKLIQSLSEWMPAASERFARSAGAIAGYIVGKDFFKMHGDDLLSFSRQFSQNPNFLYSAADRPRLLTGPLGSSFGLFKTWLINQMAWMAEYAGLGVKHGQWGPLLYTLGGTAAIGGIGAMPGYALADWGSKALTNQSILEHLNDGFFADKPMIGDSLMYGLPASLGVTMQSQTALTGAQPLRDATMFFNMAQWDRIQALGALVGDSWDRITKTGENPLESREVANSFVRAVAPRSIQRIFQTIEGNAIRSLHSGYPYMDVPQKDRILYSLGFNPTSIEKFHDIHEELWSNRDMQRSMITELGQALAEAWIEGDDAATQRLMRRAVASGVSLDSVLRSAQTVQDKMQSPAFTRSFTPEQASAAWQLLGGEP